MIKYIESKFFILICLALSVIPFYNIENVYSWHIKQPEFVQGGIMLVSLGILMILVWLFYKKIVIPYIVLTSVYLYFHGVLLPVAVMVLYIAMYMYFGRCICKEVKSRYFLSIYFLYGVCLWGTGAVIISLFGYGTIICLDIYTTILLIYFIVSKKGIQIVNVIRKIVGYKIVKISEIIPFIVILLAISALFAKTNIAHDYDSLWYGLRTQYVLIGENSFYDDLGYMAFVYYYPKMVELFYAPISFIKDYSFIISGNIIIYTLLLINCGIFIKKISRKSILYVVAMIACIPALANISATAKPDIWGVFFVVTGVCIWEDFRREKKYEWLILAYLFIGLSFFTKLTYILWGGICLFYISMILIKSKNINIQELKKSFWEYRLLIVIALAFMSGVVYRTIYLTGTPFYPLFITDIFTADNIFLKTEKAYIFDVDLSNININMILYRLYQFVFDPSKLGHVVMLWTSNVYVIFLFIYFFQLRKQIKNHINNVFLVCMLLLGMVYYMVGMLGPDGNYFILPIIMIILLLINMCDVSLIDRFCNEKMLIILCTLFPIMFVSHSSWRYGTQAFPTSIIINNYENEGYNLSLMQHYGLSNIYNEVAMFECDDRVISSCEKGDDHVMHRMPCALERFAEIDNTALSNTLWSDNYESFSIYLNKINIKAAILLYDDNSKFSKYIECYKESHQPLKIVYDEKAVCYIFR